MADIVDALLNPNAYDEAVKNIRLVQTHISWIFLTGKHVYKVKKPVNFGFLDFTTLQKRKLFCEKELELNKRLAPDMYLEVVPINQSGGKIKIKGDGETIEYAVKMKELPQETMMSKLLERNDVNNRMIDRIAKIVSDFHSKTKKINRNDSFNVIRFNWDECFSQTKPFINITIGKENFDYIESTIKKFMTNNKTIFERRINEGKIRECHGDLHSGNIFISDKIYIFDAIEFNDRFRFCDVASEVAFLTMDLDFQNKQDLSIQFIGKYIEYSKDHGIKKLLDFYKCYRAYVRGKVTSFKLNDKDVSKEEKLESENLAKKYFNLAFNYSKKLGPRLVVMCGLTGTGKSNVSKNIAKIIKGKIIRSDIVRKELGGISSTKHKFDDYNRGLYSEEFTDRTYSEMINIARETLTKGISCVLDATFSKKEYRKEAANLEKELNLPFFIVECICPEHVIRNRLDKRIKGKSVSDGRWEIYLDQKKDFEPIGSDEREHIVIDTTKKNDLEKVLT